MNTDSGIKLSEDLSPEEFTKLSAKDSHLGAAFDQEFLNRFEVHSYRNASKILADSEALRELIGKLREFDIATDDIVSLGGNKSKIAKKMDTLLNPIGWYETRIQGDLVVRKMSYGLSKSSTKRQKNVVQEDKFRISNFIDGHKIDFVKDRLAFDMEWNSKDQTFDRDLYALRAFYECGIIDAGVLLTPSSYLMPLFAEIGQRVHISNFKSKYGASTTWMGKLTYRLDAGRAGGCPIIAIGIKPPVVTDFDRWKATHPVITGGIDASDLLDGDALSEEDE